MATVLITGTNKGVGLEMTKIYAARVDTVIVVISCFPQQWTWKHHPA